MSETCELFILSNMGQFGGAERSIATLVPHLADALPVRIFVENDRHYEDLARLGHARVRLVRVPKGNSPFALAAALWKIATHFIRERPRAVLVNGHKGAFLFALAHPFLAWHRAQIGVFIRDFDFYTLPFILASLRSARFFAPTDAVFENPRYAKWGLGTREHEAIPNAVKLPTNDPSSESEPFIGCCARLLPWKGVDFLIQAFAQIAVEFPAVKVRVYGEAIDGDYAVSLRALVAECRLEGRVEFPDFESDPERIFGPGLFFVVPSVSTPPGPETFGRIVIEAWSWRKPVIAFNCGGPARLIRDGEDGFLVEERNVTELAERMCELLRDDARRRAMGARGYERTRAEFDPALIARRVLTSLLREPAK